MEKASCCQDTTCCAVVEATRTLVEIHSQRRAAQLATTYGTTPAFYIYTHLELVYNPHDWCLCACMDDGRRLRDDMLPINSRVHGEEPRLTVR